MKCDQRAIRFNCLGSGMVGIIDLPERPLPRGVLMVACQPHSRLGAQRQLAMLARTLARRGFAVMRFDRRGVGDSEGRDYNDSDVRAAMHEFCEQVPALRQIVLLAPAGDAAIATASACARIDQRVCGLLLLDPWRRGARRAAASLAPPPSTPAPIGAALFWRRAQAPRRGATARARLADLAGQLCAFPGPVLLLAGGAEEALAHDELTQLRTLVERGGGGARIGITIPVTADATDAGSRFEADYGSSDPHADPGGPLVDSCASWIVRV